MPIDSSTILRDNLRRLIGDQSLRAWSDYDMALAKIVTRLVSEDGPVHSPTLESLDRIAQQAGVETWQLLKKGGCKKP